MNKKLILIGLGNPLEEYKNTPHNAGRNFIDWLANSWQAEKWQKDKKTLTQICFFKKEGFEGILAKPLVFMNDSGKSAKLLKQFYKIPVSHFLVFHDDGDINLGKFKISYNRGSAGHKGVESIIKNFNSKKFFRYRIGIRPPDSKKQKTEKFVLKNLKPEEKTALYQSFPAIEEELKQTLKIISQELKNQD